MMKVEHLIKRDSNGRVTGEFFTNEGYDCVEIRYQYDEKGNLSERVASDYAYSIKTKYCYDSEKRLVSEYIDEYIDELSNVDGIILPSIGENKDSWHQFVMRVKDKEGLCKFLTQNGVGNGNFYPVPLHKQKAFDTNITLPISEMLASETVCLPIYPELTVEEIEYVILKVKEFFGVDND
mgnify:CR=1 FL=1